MSEVKTIQEDADEWQARYRSVCGRAIRQRRHGHELAHSHHHSHEKCRPCWTMLAAIAGQSGRFEPEIVAIDSGIDGRHGDQSAVVRRSSTFSLRVQSGQTRNDALKAVDGDFAILLVQDAIPPANVALCAGPASPGRPCRRRDFRTPGSNARASAQAHYLAQWIAAMEPRTVGPLRPEVFAGMTPADRHAICAGQRLFMYRISVWKDHPFAATPIGEDSAGAGRSSRAIRWPMFPVRSSSIHTSARRMSFSGPTSISACVVWFVDGPTIGSLVRSIATTFPSLRVWQRTSPARVFARFCEAPRSGSQPLGQHSARAVREGRERQTRGSECESFRSSVSPAVAPRSTLAISRRRCGVWR